MGREILDKIEEIKNIDKNDMLSFCVEAPKHCSKAIQMAKNVSIGCPAPQTIIVAGMGGSGICGDLLRDWTRDNVNIPIEVSKGYYLPAYANKNSLVLIASYSGETEESLNTFLDAVKRKCMVFCVSSNGKLLKFAERLGFPFLRIPLGMPPRAALPFQFLPMLVILEKIGLVSNVSSEFSETIKILKKVSVENSPERMVKENFSKMLALNISGTIPIVYGFGFYRAVAQRLKQQFNENSKVPSKWDVFPELNHNEVMGWEKVGRFSKVFSTILIRDRNEFEEIRYRIEATKDLITSKSSKVSEVWSLGKNRLAKIWSVICVGDFISIYLSVLLGVDPTPVKTITLFKEKMRQSGIKDKIIRKLEKLV